MGYEVKHGNVLRDAWAFVEGFAHGEIGKKFPTYPDPHTYVLLRAEVLKALEKQIPERDWRISPARRAFLTALIEGIAEEVTEYHGVDFYIDNFRERAYKDTWLWEDAEVIAKLKQEKETMNPTTQYIDDYKADIRAGRFNFDRPAVEKRNLIYGVDSKDLRKEDIYSVIAELENRIEALDRIKNKPESLKADIKAYQEQIDELVKFVDKKLAV